MSNRIKVIERKPDTAWGVATPETQTRIAGFEIGNGEVTFHPQVVDLSRQILWPLMMASLGMSNPKIATSLHLNENTVKAHIAKGMTELELTRHRSALTRHFFDIGIYEVRRIGEHLELTPKEHEVVEHISRGLATKKAADIQGIASCTIKSHLANVSARNDLNGREEIIFASIVSGEIGDYALRNTIEGIGPQEALSFLQVSE